MADPGVRFRELVQRPVAELPLDEAVTLVAAHAHEGLDVAATLGRLDALAERAPSSTVDGVVDAVFVQYGLRGNQQDYYDPRNSLLDDVLDRRLGIPITLAVVTMEVGRRLGVGLCGIGMPGHFLVGVDAEPGVYLDPFDGGRRLDVAGCEARFRMLQPPGARFTPELLGRADAHAILLRILTNLRRAYTERGDAAALGWVLGLLGAIPGAPPHQLAELN